MRAPFLSRSHRRRRGKVDYPIEIEFDGDEVDFFDGGWSESGGNVLNDQLAVGSELVVNGDFTNWTGDNPNNWVIIGEVGADPEVSEVGTGQGHGGGGNGLANLFASAENTQPRMRQMILIVGTWVQITIDIDTFTAGTLKVGDIIAGVNQDYTTIGSKFQTGLVDNDEFQLRPVLAPSDVTVDNVSVKLITLTSIFNVLKSQFGLSDGFFIDIYINVVTAGTQVGVIWNYDGSNNFGMAYMDGVSLKVDKNVAGTYSSLATVAQAVTQDQILRIENPVGTNVITVKYNGVSKATPTIADASVIGNKGIALFSTEANNAISKVAIGKL